MLFAFCIGSNQVPGANIRRALAVLQQRFGALRRSSVYRSAAEGFVGDDFLNLAALVETDESVADVVAWLKALERRLCRDHRQPSYSSRTIDVDVFLPGTADGAHGSLTIPHREVLENAFILCPLAELLPNQRLQADGPTLADLWQHFDKTRQPLTLVQLD